MAIHLTPEANPTVQEGTLYVDSATGEFNVAGRTVPHIIPGVLYPAVSGNDLSGTALGGSYVYGTAHTDGRKYYYTDIKGSKPIKDPRIGGHFGSQRHKFKSLQLLEQETATHGKDVYSIDGREWCRVVGSSITGMINHDHGHYLQLDATGDFIEITGYFNNFNTIAFTHSTRADDVSVKINGGTSRDNDIIAGKSSVLSPLNGRYVDTASVINHGDTNVTSDLGTTPRINTLKLELTNISSEQFLAFGIELIAQDTTSTANRSKIQIPSQDVVSYGKKFTVSGTPHYNPFNNQTIGDNTSHGKNTVGWTTYDSTLDTATSLGLDAWVDSGNYYRPVNGGRVIKWVDSSGDIKTSVNMMPPSAKAIGTHSGSSGPHQTAWTSTYQPVFSSGSVDHTQSEVAKTYHWREFGNGSANGGTDSSSYPDASMLSGTDDDIAYVMDDGLTSLSGYQVKTTSKSSAVGGEAIGFGDGDYTYYTFIGTGVSANVVDYNVNATQKVTIAQNLPYGSHILKHIRSGTTLKFTIDGVEVYSVSSDNAHWALHEITFHQPKKPPIPEDACVLADYMLMADFVIKGTNTGGNGVDAPFTSKGVRRLDCSRDVFYNGASFTVSQNLHGGSGSFFAETGTVSTLEEAKATIPAFATNFSATGYDMNGRNRLDLNGSTATFTNSNTGNGHGTFHYLTNDTTLGVNDFTVENLAGGRVNFAHFEIATPIHTSSHYQSFETPFLHELVGGDRNMEQTNLVVSPDGKTWDKVTRDTSYIGKNVVSASHSTDSWLDDNTHIVFDEHRGGPDSEGSARYTKDSFTLAYDRYICLKEGQYRIVIRYLSRATNSTLIKLNGTRVAGAHHDYSNYSSNTLVDVLQLVRGDYVQIYDEIHGGVWAHFYIEKV